MFLKSKVSDMFGSETILLILGIPLTSGDLHSIGGSIKLYDFIDFFEVGTLFLDTAKGVFF